MRRRELYCKLTRRSEIAKANGGSSISRRAGPKICFFDIFHRHSSGFPTLELQTHTPLRTMPSTPRWSRRIRSLSS